MFVQFRKLVIYQYSFIEAAFVTSLGLFIYLINFLRDGFKGAPISYFFLFLLIFITSFLISISKLTKKKIYFKKFHIKNNLTHTSINKWITISAGVVFYLSISRDLSVSRIWLLSFLILLLPLMLIVDNRLRPLIMAFLERKSSKLNIKTCLIGSNIWIKKFSKILSNDKRLVGIDLGKSLVIKNDFYNDEVLNWIIDNEPDLLIVSDELIDKLLLTLIVDLSDRRGFKLSVEISSMKSFQRELELESYGEYSLSFNKEPAILDPINRAIKRLMDIVISIPVIIFLLPPLYFLVYFIQLLAKSRGEVFFKQQRLGKGGKEFEVIKFRTMHVADFDENKQATKNDSRIYSGGNFLRKFNIDEFPQFINTLRGNMSVVGPRPHLKDHERLFEDTYRYYGLRRISKPGITGLSQIKGLRGEITENNDIRNRAVIDVSYIENWSVFLDIKIILITFFQCIFPNKNAY